MSTIGDFGPTVSRLQSNVQSLQEETETCQRAAGELRDRRDSLQRRVDEADRQLAERRAALNQFQFKLKSQGLLVEDCEKRAKEAEQENAAVQAELTQMRDAIATEKRERLERLEAADGRVQGLARRFRDASLLSQPDEATPESDSEATRARVDAARETVARLVSQLEADQGQHMVPPDVKSATLKDAQACVDGLKRQLGL
ncbi:hypothetical protein FJT64_025333 [Amphibalanus amphitrite]|uniref:Uncharacterized protein n=1 Tax=Amphibalanus amphitrite TaxID=1232801 RepID=A0A6A4WFE7_AMPAM|nr:uncharacterized protein LOC122389900 [Amphibalanus amphitrite]XP_043238317.1 uncharacterized protein LOC122389900 [Amphibalanus amphitrite]XP_043238318.1 uncharacterized protein LOC122389900 [Amphibalanus amphitrite]XP_043238319.1 uncharacterized protein LOC122389900 [Amphibalanus amphitrite]XP_043238321.1 uncharacterized protein LOC122389900 [Amphibalanus amphitrite]KAF0302564.1 hypothetical protein FJT64_025333 [Amphibalanus amphitrite]